MFEVGLRLSVVGESRDLPGIDLGPGFGVVGQKVACRGTEFGLFRRVLRVV